MEPEKGDDYLRRLAAFIRDNEKGLAEAGISRRRRAQTTTANISTDLTSYLNPLSWIGWDASNGAAPKPTILSTDTHHLFYVLMRLEALGYDVGTLDVHIDNPSRPMSYVNLFTGPDKSDTLSLASIRSSLSAVSKLSLGAALWGRAEPPSIDQDLKYIYSSFTKLPALTIHAPTKHAIAELLADPPGQNALPLDAFKNIQTLNCIDVDPRTLLGWDRLAESLRSLVIKKSGLEDISDIFIGAVVDDQARREGSQSRSRRRRLPKRYGKAEVGSTPLPDAVIEDSAGESAEESVSSHTTSPSPPPTLGSLKWAFLKYLSLADNALTFIPPEPLAYLTSVTHLDLSSNLLVSVPPGLGTLFNLISLNLSDNMIDSVLGIYLNLGSILSLNLSHNRLESLCGLERLRALERVDLRGNLIEESEEVGRLATLPNISQVWVEGNPFCEYEEDYRVACFNLFWKEGKTISLDGSLPGFYEKRNMSAPAGRQAAAIPQSNIIAHSPPVVPIGKPPPTDRTASPQPLPTPPSSNASPHLAPIAAPKPKRRHQKRIVDLAGEGSGGNTPTHSKSRSEESPEGRSMKSKKGRKATKAAFAEAVPQPPAPTSPETSPSQPGQPARRTRHSRYQTEFAPTSPPRQEERFVTAPTPFSAGSPPSRSATLSPKSAMRRARQSASMYEGPAGEEGEDETHRKDSVDEYRRRIEALKQDMGDGWLKVFSQSEIKT
ncbi:leucine Rich Repeat domain-containing protein [Coprinopsis cinerea okayama7|uniref:Leucine Rich Repeat domain-containing protein n=1 Tax=Coprinopsis cinerea (strain Okayama-7 / 130 / ATCC MYA-4618 / FGSC 9003) TaxID=240176 RepID=A8N6U7_COPC7|nr:leucine Rich Repeat domain-containing protein [Coprinopsis cinerea okayama7\|eukprot:XP_001830553.1 leucine Rich Repeat domain-containing protein [Coprinopsis cinerea okayama7\